MTEQEAQLQVRVVSARRSGRRTEQPSRRATYLAPEREAAPCLFLALSEAATAARGGERDAATLIAIMAREIGATPQARLDYAAVVDAESFEEVSTLARPARALVAAWFGQVRLIDNLLLPS
jgi:pantoate--beta-alanine ligase